MAIVLCTDDGDAKNCLLWFMMTVVMLITEVFFMMTLILTMAIFCKMRVVVAAFVVFFVGVGEGFRDFSPCP